MKNKYKHFRKTNTCRLYIDSPKHGKFVAVVDLEDAEKVKQYHWHVAKTSKRRGRYYIASSTGGYLHRLIANAPKGKEVDHISGDTLDNRKANLRLCGQFENQQNRERSSTNTSGYKGVWKLPQAQEHWLKPWSARLYHKGKSHYLGTFGTAAKAARAYDKKALELHGEFANLNFPQESYSYTEGETKEFTIVSKVHGTHKVILDAEDWVMVSQYKWSLNRNVRNKHKKVFYITSNSKKAIEDFGKRGVKLHRVIIDCPSDKVVDHINGNTLDNRKANLRIVSRRDNKHNRNRPSNNTSGFVGVVKVKGGRWHARIGDGHSKHRYIGIYNTKEEAAIARDKEVIRTREIVDPERQLNFPHKLQEYLKENQVETGGA